jgi:hypothetical protein
MSTLKIITGVGRCGTSMLMEYCKRIGLNVGGLNWLKQYDAGNESHEAIEINQYLLKNGLNQSMADRIKAIDLAVIKDPRFLVDPKLIEMWWYCRKDIELVYLTRNPFDIVDSQKRKPTMNTPSYRCFPDLIVEHETKFIEKIQILGIPYATLVYPDFLKQYGRVNSIFSNNKHIWEDLKR